MYLRTFKKPSDNHPLRFIVPVFSFVETRPVILARPFIFVMYIHCLKKYPNYLFEMLYQIFRIVKFLCQGMSLSNKSLSISLDNVMCIESVFLGMQR